MSESLATRSPETDAMEDAPSFIPGDSAAQTGASMGDHCTTDRPIQSDLAPKGEMSKFDSIDVYISKPADYPQSPSKLLLLLTGGTGVHSTNNKLQADKFVEHGYVVVMPDQFGGDPAPNTVPTEPQENASILEQVKLRAAETAKSFMIDMWLARHTSEKVMPILHKVLDNAKDEFADAVANGGGIYAVGYCFGAKYVIMLAGEHPETVLSGQAVKDVEGGVKSTGPLIKAGSIAHPTLTTRDDLLAMKAPISMACVENDPLFPDEILNEGRKYLETSNVVHEVKIYSGVPHGFAVFGDYPDSKIKESQAVAFDQMLSWIQKF